MGLLDWNLALFSLQFGSSHERFLYEKADKEKKKKHFPFGCILFGYLGVHLNHVVSLFFLCFCMSYATSFSVSSSNKKIKETKTLNGRSVEVSFWIFKHLFPLITCWQVFCWCARNGLGERCARRLGERTHMTGVRHTWGHVTPTRQNRAQTDTALLNGSFY